MSVFGVGVLLLITLGVLRFQMYVWRTLNMIRIDVLKGGV